jgi:AraC-like DNA-binding protein
MYIGYVGAYAMALTDRLRLNARHCYYAEFTHLLDIWQTAIAVDAPFDDFAAEGALLLTLADIASRMGVEKENDRRESGAFFQIKRHIDEHFADPDLSLELLAHELNYNAKYISTLFKRRMQVGVAEYINILRVQQACTLMAEGITSVKDLSFLCGFRDPLYFSKVFKMRMGISPSGHIERLSQQTDEREMNT